MKTSKLIVGGWLDLKKRNLRHDKCQTKGNKWKNEEVAKRSGERQRQ